MTASWGAAQGFAKKKDEFKDAESARKNKEIAQSEAFVDEEEVADPIPLAIIPGLPNNGAAPYLSKEILEGIATGFL